MIAFIRRMFRRERKGPSINAQWLVYGGSLERVR